MDKKQLEETQKVLRSLIESRKAHAPLTKAFDTPEELRLDSLQAKRQKRFHRDKLLKLISRLSVYSFIFLVFIILFQMVVRLWRPEYEGVSDTVINIITGGVFGEVIAVVAVIAHQVWKD
ncbi:MAG TPA: hypothetical protein VFX86_03320 [Candidatus Saccharimonadales bacterium]|nr:hypothetical protein [Candidatus Saccharimonadales bacterium]